MNKTTDYPHILMVANYYHQIGGSGISVLVDGLSAGLISEGYKVTIHSVSGFLPRIWLKHSGRRLLRYISLIFAIRKYDLIHCHGGGGLGFLPIFVAAFFASLFKKPLIMTYHSSPDTVPFIENNFAVKMVVRKFAVITTPFEVTAKPFRSYGVESVAIPNILNIEDWQFKKRTDFKPNIVWTRNFYFPELAIESFCRLKEKYPSATLTMCGRAATPENQGKYRNIAGLNLLGYIPRNKLPDILAEADIYLNTAGHDSFGYAIYEAMAMGLAIVSVPSPALFSLSGNKVIRFSATNSPETITNTIEEVLANQAQTAQKTAYGKKVVEQLGWEHLFPVWKKLYDTVLQEL